MLKRGCEVKTCVFLVLHSSISLKAIFFFFFFEKMNQFPFESYINTNRKKKENRKNNVTKKAFLNISFAALDLAHGYENVYTSKFLAM